MYRNHYNPVRSVVVAFALGWVFGQFFTVVPKGAIADLWQQFQTGQQRLEQDQRQIPGGY